VLNPRNTNNNPSSRITTMSKPAEISSPTQLSSLLSSSRVSIVSRGASTAAASWIANGCCPVYNEENQSSKAIAPVYEQLAGQLARPGRVAFARVSVVGQATIAQGYSVTKYV
jgi:hypothetical protein